MLTKVQNSLITVAASDEDLNAREALLRSITNAAQDAVIPIDSAGLVTYWSPAPPLTRLAKCEYSLFRGGPLLGRMKPCG